MEGYLVRLLFNFGTPPGGRVGRLDPPPGSGGPTQPENIFCGIVKEIAGKWVLGGGPAGPQARGSQKILGGWAGWTPTPPPGGL